ncbi:hypothetical protein [Burkholderia pseudomallei]|uniref:hypothetical protein n=2 Tax=Burkholderia pseudomallei TaxID=28450 RepID=UPI0011780DD3|nr:hypothetical protein [Burkholderia pseudomallei]MBM5665783.1 hypothetical protein [Burkholderia pseudomallei]
MQPLEVEFHRQRIILLWVEQEAQAGADIPITADFKKTCGAGQEPHTVQYLAPGEVRRGNSSPRRARMDNRSMQIESVAQALSAGIIDMTTRNGCDTDTAAVANRPAHS